MNSNQKFEFTYDGILSYLKNNRIVAVILVLIVIFFGATKIINEYSKAKENIEKLNGNSDNTKTKHLQQARISLEAEHNTSVKFNKRNIPLNELLSEAKVDESTGAVTLRAIFPNSNNILLPGMYVSARLTQSVITNAALVPQSAVTRTPKSETQVYIVDENNKIQVRPVTINGTYDGQWVVTEGLKAGDKVVVIGGAKVKPDQEVVAKPLESANPAPAAAKNAPNTKTPQQAAKTMDKKPAGDETSTKKPTEAAAN